MTSDEIRRLNRLLNFDGLGVRETGPRMRAWGSDELKGSVGALAHQIVQVGVRPYGNTGLVFPDVGFDGGLFGLVSNRHTMVAITHEVRITHLVEFYGR